MAMNSLTGAVHVSSSKPAWDDSALKFIAELIDATRRDLAATLVVRMALKAGPRDDGQAALSALLTSQWPKGLDVVDFVDKDAWPERERALMARQRAREVEKAQHAERQRRAADRAAREAVRATELEAKMADEAARQEANRHRFPRNIAK